MIRKRLDDKGVGGLTKMLSLDIFMLKISNLQSTGITNEGVEKYLCSDQNAQAQSYTEVS